MSGGADKNFRLDVDSQTSTVIFRPIGHWTHDEVDRWEASIASFILQQVATGAVKYLVVDLRERGPHSQDIAARVQAGVSRFSRAFERVAIVLPNSAIMGLQARRIAPQPNQSKQQERRFASDAFDAALHWITSQDLPDSSCA